MKDTIKRWLDEGTVDLFLAYKTVMEHPLHKGRFLVPVDGARGTPVCVLGHDAARDLFPLCDPIGQVVKVEGQPFEVVGVMARKGQTGSHSVLSNPDNTEAPVVVNPDMDSKTADTGSAITPVVM